MSALESVRRILRITTSRPALLTVAAIAVLLFVGECRAHLDALRSDETPRIAINAPRFERYRPATLDATLSTWRPPEREAKRIERTFQTPIRADGETEGADLLAHKVIPVDCEGGGTRTVEIIATLPEGEGPREVEVRSVVSGREFFDLRARYEIGGLYGRSFDGSTRSRAWAATEPARLGRFYLRAEAGLDVRGGESDAYALVGVVWRSR